MKMPLKSRTNGISTGGVVGAFDDFVDDVLSFVERLFSSQKLTLDEFAAKSGDEIDKIILNKLKQGHEFAVGRFKLVYVSEYTFKFAFEVFLKDPKQKDYVEMKGESKPISLTRLQPSAFEELRDKKEITYEIDEPKSQHVRKVESGEPEPVPGGRASVESGRGK